MKMRVQRILARAGKGSRRSAEELITAGRVRVNGQVAELGSSADPDRDTVTLDGKRVQSGSVQWFALNKPVGYIVSKADVEGMRSVFGLMPRLPGLTYVGRLDVMTGGLLLFTTDGTAANRLTHPRYKVPRTYRVRVHGRTPAEIAQALNARPVIEGRAVAITSFTVKAREGGGGAVDLTLELTEGRNRIVRRLCEAIGLKVERLVRLSHGPIRLGTLPPGEWRELTPKELKALERTWT
ncbi:MAG: pseudouridine synthase [Gemmatimonadales bacterium]